MGAGFFHNAIDLRKVEGHLLHPTIANAASGVESNGSMWLVSDHDPLELHDFLNQLGFTVQTFAVARDEFWIFLGRIG
ncbi:MAG: DUF2249 domain-containing protein [Verrucomicrobiota bacterium]